MASRYTSLRKGIKMKSRSWSSLCLDTWFPEIIAISFSIACFVAICGILFAYNQERRHLIVPVEGPSVRSRPYSRKRDGHSRLLGQWFFTSVAIAKKLDYFVPTIEYDSVYSSGLWSESEDNELSPSCPSGNCTWKKFQSSGMCSQCSEITESVDLKCEKIVNDTIHFPHSDDTHQDTNVTCHLTPPQGNSTQFDLNFSFYPASSGEEGPGWWHYNTKGLSWHVFSAWADKVWDGGIWMLRPHTYLPPFTWPGDPLMVIAYAEIGYNAEYLDSDLLSGIKVDKATECSLELCLLEYEVSVQNGTQDIITSVLDYGQLLWRNSSVLPFKDQTLCWKPTPGPTVMMLKDPPPGHPFVQLSSTDFEFCGVPYAITLHEDVFVGSFSQIHAWSSGVYTNSNYVEKPEGDLNTLHINSVGLDKIMSNVAKHITKKALQSNGSDVHGIAHGIEVFVEVQWLWLILPMILVVSGTIFIAIVIFENRQSGTSLWKSSVLAFFYHGLYDVDKDDCMAASVMESKAEGLVVQLQASGGQGLILQERKNLEHQNE
ncbi:unnamed protein product [Penicillium salamii]|uniref:Uncharacterized protein n=1 Tax=Penicillium salamii TaxID=1612424 RepID=A0A9W4NK16_9EURO|nr:unnamed protein product [Penicillium salamii]